MPADPCPQSGAGEKCASTGRRLRRPTYVFLPLLRVEPVGAEHGARDPPPRHAEIILGGLIRPLPSEDRVLAVGGHCFEAESVGLADRLAGRQAPDTLAQESAQPCDARVGRRAVLEVMDGDGPLRDLSFVVARLALPLLVRAFVLALTHEVDGLPADPLRIVLPSRVQPRS